MGEGRGNMAQLNENFHITLNGCMCVYMRGVYVCVRMCV